MKLMLRFVIIMIVLLTSAWMVSAEIMPVEPDTVKTYTSENGRYEVAIIYGDGLPSWSLKEDGQELWSEPMPGEAGAATVSDNGETITLPLWGWRDEGGSSGVAVYNKQGKLVKEISFKGRLMGKETLMWVRENRLSPDGKYLAIGGNGKDNASVTLFEAATGKLVWEKNVGLPGIVEIKISEEGKYVLVATREDKDIGMEFVLLDREGTVIWSQKLDNNLSYDVKDYLKFKDDGVGFEVYDLNSAKYISGSM